MLSGDAVDLRAARWRLTMRFATDAENVGNLLEIADGGADRPGLQFRTELS